MKNTVFALAVVPLLAAWVLTSPAASGAWGRRIASSMDVLALFLTPTLWSAGQGSETFGVFLAASILGALAFAAVSPGQDVESLGRLHLGASLSIVAVSTTELTWSALSMLLFGALLPGRKRARLLLLAPALAILGGVGLVAANDGGRPGLILLAAGLPAWWLLVSREVLRDSSPGLVTRMAAAFALLVAVSAAHLRIAVWFPESAPTGAAQVLAIAALALGVLGALGATRVTTFLTALALARAGLLLFSTLGGVQGRAPALILLAASGISLLLLAAALENVETLDEISGLGPVSRRLVLTLGALSACSFPPFPGFVALFPLSSSLADRGYSTSLLVSAALLFLLGLGVMRLVSRAWSGERERENAIPVSIGLAAIVLALAAILAFSIAPAPLVGIAGAAALAVF